MLAAAVQLSSTLDQPHNLAQAAIGIQHAAQAGAKLIVLPEMFALYGDLTQVAAQAETLTGPLVQQLGRWAKEHGIWLVAGTIAELAGTQVYNTSLLFDPQGNIQAQYRKRHLFNIDLRDRVRCSEGDLFTSGQELTQCYVNGLQVGWGICFDLRFPEQFRQLSAQGVQVLVVPSAFTATTGRDHWLLLCRARAVENLCYVIAANQVGTHSPQMSSYGHSCIIDPWGNVLATAGEQALGCAIAELDLTQLNELRERLPVHRLRRDR